MCQLQIFAEFLLACSWVCQLQIGSSILCGICSHFGEGGFSTSGEGIACSRHFWGSWIGSLLLLSITCSRCALPALNVHTNGPERNSTSIMFQLAEPSHRLRSPLPLSPRRWLRWLTIGFEGAHRAVAQAWKEFRKGGSQWACVQICVLRPMWWDTVSKWPYMTIIWTLLDVLRATI